MQGRAPAVLRAELELVVPMSEAHRVSDAETRHVVCVEPCRDRTNEGVKFRIVHKDLRQIYRLHASEELAIGGAMFRGADSGSFPAPEWQIHGCIGCGTVNLENSGARPSEKIFDSLRRGGKNGGSQTLLHVVAQRDRLVPIPCLLHDEYRTERFFL